MQQNVQGVQGVQGVQDIQEDKLHTALARLAHLAAGSHSTAMGSMNGPLETAVGRIAAWFGLVPISVRAHPGESALVHVERLAGGMGLSVRQVSLRSGWLLSDAGPLLAFTPEGQPLALLPSGGRYVCWNPQTGQEIPLGDESTLAMGSVAFCFYRRLPDRADQPGQAMRLLTLLSFGLRGLRADVLTLLACAAGGGLLGLAVPMMTALVFDEIVPGHFRGLLVQAAVALAVLALLQLVWSLANGVAMLRIESKLKLALQAATLDRLIRLPAAFFRQHAAGDLGQRALGVEVISSLVTGSVASSLFAGIFSIFGFALLFHYHWQAALVAVGLSVLLAGTAALAGILSMRALKDKERLAGSLSAMVLELFNGMERIRLAGAEARLFTRWAHRYADMSEISLRAQRINALFSAFNTGYRILAVGVIFGALAWLGLGEAGGGGRMATGAFLAFVSAFGTSFVALSQMAGTLVDLLSIGPIWQRMRPIMESPVEATAGGADPGPLSGLVEMNNLHFRYAEGLPNVLRGISLRATAGEFIAIVGSSGCGKSTLFRLLLGFEKLAAGAIYIDGHELGSLDIRAVRRQIGTVLQHDTLITGSIYENIRGAHDISQEEAWEAARLAGIGEHIASLPMGMHTMLGDNPGFSGGEVQRLLIARALAMKPRILLLDEATSALDNRTQAEVSANLASLTVTRIVIAHRLSTIEAADRIYVLDGGVVVQEGPYQKLIEEKGLFAELVRKQLI